MRIDALKEHWEAYGRSDPLWAVLSEPGLQGNRWDLEEFLRRGEREVADYLAELEGNGVQVRYGRALDFGCGVGRLTQALGERFERCDGVDIAASMVEQARRLNRHGDRVAYHVNPASDLHLFPSETFDFVLSIIVLQHMEPRYAKGYIAEFLRVLRPGGIAVFQLPTGHRRPEHSLPDGAWRASFRVDRPPHQLSALQSQSIVVGVRNESDCPWPPDQRVRLADHWLDARAEMAIVDDARTELPRRVEPGEEIELALLVTAPSVPGRYQLELDMVQDGVGWFAQRGSGTLRLPVEVSGADGRGRGPTEPAEEGGAPAPPERARPPGQEEFQPRIEMYSVPREEVLEVVGAAGGVVVHAFPDINAGADFDGLRYVARREAPPGWRPGSRVGRAVDALLGRLDMVLPPGVAPGAGRRSRLALAARGAVSRRRRSQS